MTIPNTLHALHLACVAMAGDDMSWPVSGTSVPRGDAFPGLVAWLARWQAGTCPACGDEFGNETLEVCHIVSRGTSKSRGYVAGNIYLGHKGCNTFDKSWNVVPLTTFMRPELIATEYPTRSTMLSMATNSDCRQSARDARRMALHNGR